MLEAKKHWQIDTYTRGGKTLLKSLRFAEFADARASWTATEAEPDKSKFLGRFSHNGCTTLACK